MSYYHTSNMGDEPSWWESWFGGTNTNQEENIAPPPSYNSQTQILDRNGNVVGYRSTEGWSSAPTVLGNSSSSKKRTAAQSSAAPAVDYTAYSPPGGLGISAPVLIGVGIIFFILLRD